MAEAMKYGKEEFAVTLPAEKIAAELEPNRVELPQRTVAAAGSAGPCRGNGVHCDFRRHPALAVSGNVSAHFD